jgi:hypothetical protein
MTARHSAAYFQLRADYFGRPFDDGIIRALLDAGYAVDLYAPGGAQPQDLYDDRVRRIDVEYRRGWIARNLGRRRWRDYDLFLGNPDIGTAVAFVLAKTARRPFVNCADEIFFGGYEGEAFLYWKRLAQWGAHAARFTVITDFVRNELQRRFAKLSADHRFLPYPSVYAYPYAGPSREEARRTLAVGDELLLSLTGAVTSANGGHWAIRALDQRPAARLLVQPGNPPDAVLDAFLARDPRIIYFHDRLGWEESMRTTIAADVGLVFYLSPKPQFQQMGVSSQKLGTCLWLGVPIIATRQPSFAFVEETGCGLLIDDESELPAAIERLSRDRMRFRDGCSVALRTHVRAGEKLHVLTEAFRRCVSS